MNPHPLLALSRIYLQNQSFSVSTLKTYRIVFQQYINYLTENKIEFATTRDVINYREHKRSLGYSSSWLYIQISALKGLYRYLRLHHARLGLPQGYAYDLMKPIKNGAMKPTLKKPILSYTQAKQLLLHTKTHRQSFWHYRDHAILYLMITSGLSVYEVVHALRIDYTVSEGIGMLRVMAGKGKKRAKDWLKLSSGANIALQEYLTLRKDDNPYLFISRRHPSRNGALSRTFFRDMLPRVLKDCGLDGLGITPHCLRHSAAIFNLERGGSLEQTRQLMRHKEISSTLVYQDYLNRLKDDSEAAIERMLLSEREGLVYDSFWFDWDGDCLKHIRF